METYWVALMIGNSRTHWAYFHGNALLETGDAPHTASPVDVMATWPQDVPPTVLDLWIASVVPDQTPPWVQFPKARLLSLADVPLQGLYPTLGIDRALAVYGAIATGGGPVLVIDGGTALTLTGVDPTGTLVGGAILPGLRLQFESLGQRTALLPILDPGSAAGEPLTGAMPPPSWPPRWALTTAEAIASGVLHTVTAGLHAFIQDWWRQFPGSPVILTGGDRDRLWAGLQQSCPAAMAQITVDPDLVFKGIQAIRAGTQGSRDRA